MDASTPPESLSLPDSAQLLFGKDDSPPWKLSAFLGIQHLLVALMYLIYPVLLVQESGHSAEESRFMLMATLGVTGFMTLLQARAGRRLGSGFLAVQVANPIFLPLSLAAVQLGGLGLLASLLAITGFAQVLFARVFHRLRTLFPAEVCGVVILMLGVSMVGMAIRRCTGASMDGHILPRHMAISGLTLGVIIGLNIWVKSSLRLFAVGIGIASGYAASWILGLLTAETFSALGSNPVMAFPSLALPAFQWNPTLLLPFLLTGIISSLDTAGGLILCQKMHDRHWVRPDLRNLGLGMLTDGLGNIAAGLLGSFGIGVGSSNIGLSMATGATARRIAYATGLFLLALTLFPRVTGVLVLIPSPVMGAVLVYVAAFLIVSGAHIAMSRLMDNRRTSMIGLSLLAGLGVAIDPQLFRSAPAFLHPLLGSPLAITAIVGISLNLLFRIGISKTLQITDGTSLRTPSNLFAIMKKAGAAWGARADVVQKASRALAECVEWLPSDGQNQGLSLTISYDEFNLDLALVYEGSALDLNVERPTPQQMIEDPESTSRMAGYLIQRYADRVTTRQNGPTAELRLHFEH